MDRWMTGPTYVLIFTVIAGLVILAVLWRRGSLGGAEAAKRDEAGRKADRREFTLLGVIAMGFAGALISAIQQCASGK